MSHRYSNKLILTGEEKALAAFKDAVAVKGQEVVLGLGRIVPVPTELKEKPAWHGSWEAHEWKSQHWGPTAILNSTVDGIPASGRLVYRFDSSNSELHSGFMKALSEQHPAVNMVYFYDSSGDSREGVQFVKAGKNYSGIENTGTKYSGELFAAGGQLRDRSAEKLSRHSNEL
jgi:hypothetical protein